jgi:hypothetical protein
VSDHADLREDCTFYRCTFRGEPLHVLGVGQARQALEWLRGRDWRYAIHAVVNGVEREVARGTKSLR